MEIKPLITLLVAFSCTNLFGQYPDALYYSGYYNEVFTAEVAKQFKLKKVTLFTDYLTPQFDPMDFDSSGESYQILKNWEYHFTQNGEFDTSFPKPPKNSIDSNNFVEKTFYPDGKLKSEIEHRNNDLIYTNTIDYTYFNKGLLVVRTQTYNQEKPCILDSIFYDEKSQNIKFINGDCYEENNRKKYLRWYDEFGNKVLEKTYKHPNELYTIDSSAYDEKGNYIGNYWFDFFKGKKELTDCLIIDYNEKNQRICETRYLKSKAEIKSKTEYIHDNQNKLIEKKIFDYNYAKTTLKGLKKFSYTDEGLLEKIEFFGRENSYNYRDSLKEIQILKFEFEYWD